MSRTLVLCNGGTCSYGWEGDASATNWAEPGIASAEIWNDCSDSDLRTWTTFGTHIDLGCSTWYDVDDNCTFHREKMDGDAEGTVSNTVADPGPISESFEECL